MSVVPAPRRDPSSFESYDSNAAVITLHAGTVKVRHQQPGPFEIAYDGLKPVLLYTFGPVRGGVGQGVRRQAGSRAGSFALLTPGSRLELKHPDALEVLAVACGVQEPQDLSHDAARRARTGDPPLDVVDSGVRTLAQELRRVLRHEARPDPNYVEALGRAMLVRAFQAVEQSPPRRGHGLIPTFKMRRVVEHIESRLDEKITVDELARLSGLSTAYFARAFRQTTGEAPHHFVLARRISLVETLLRDTELDLATIAVRAGFSSHAHMTTAFKRATGASPAAYRVQLAAA